MARITVYVDEETHRRLKAAASLRGKTLSGFLLEGALRLLEGDRRPVALRMEGLRRRIRGRFGAEEIRALKREGLEEASP